MEEKAPRRRRRSTANEMVTIFWRDIPAQVKVNVGGETGSWLLTERFQVAIDRAAAVAGLTNADDYVLQWRRVTTPCDGEPASAAQLEAERLHECYPSDRVQALVANGGLEPATLEDPASATTANPTPAIAPTQTPHLAVPGPQTSQNAATSTTANSQTSHLAVPGPQSSQSAATLRLRENRD